LGGVELDEHRAPLERIEVQRGRCEQIRRPGMRDHEDIRPLGHVDDFARHGKPSAARQVRLKHIHPSALDQLAEAPLGGLLLAASDEGVDRVRHLAVAVIILRVQDLLDEERPVGLEAADGLNRLLRSALDEPAGVDEKVGIVA